MAHALSLDAAKSNCTDEVELTGLRLHSLMGKQVQQEEDSLAQMSNVCPLWDSMLPLDATDLKLKQVHNFNTLNFVYNGECAPF